MILSKGDAAELPDTPDIAGLAGISLANSTTRHLKHKVLMKPRITSCVPHVLLARELTGREAHAMCSCP